MKAETLQNALAHQSRIKLYLTSQRFCLCCYVSRATATDEGLRVRTDSLLRVDFDAMTVRFEPFESESLVLHDDDRFTRRIQTHRRHLQHLDVPAEYLRRAAEL